MEWQSISRASLSVFNLHRSTIAAASSSIHVVALCRRHRRGSPPRPHALDPAGGKGGRAPHCPVLRRRRPTRERWEARRRKRRGGGGAAEVDDGVLGRAHARKGGGGVQPLVRIEGKEKGADAAGYLGKGMRATLGELRDLRRGRRRPMEGRGRRRPWEGRGSRRPWEGGRGRRIGVGDAGDLGKGGWELLRPSLLSAAGGHRPSLGGRGEWRKRSRIGKEFWAMGRGEQQPHQATCLALPLGGRDEAAPCSVPMGLLCSMVALVEFGTVSCCRLRRALGLVSPSH